MYCDSGLDNIESPGILAIIDGPEHDELSKSIPIYLRVTWGPTCRLILEHGSLLWPFSMTSLHTRLVAVGPALCPY